MADENIPGDAPTMSEEEFQSNFEAARGPASAPKPEMPQPEIRTMQSDLSALGSAPGAGIPPAAVDTGEPVFRPETVSQLERTVETPSSGGKKVFVWLGILVGVIALGGAGYFFIYPMIFPPLTEPAPITETPEAPAAPETPAVIPAHVSAFAVAPTLTVEAMIVEDTSPAIAAAIELESARPLALNSVKEVVVKTAAGPANFQNALSRLASSGTNLNQTFWDGANFESDFTAFVFYDAAGSWPGYIAKIKPVASGDAVLTAAKTAESGMRLENLYPPIGPITFESFKDGQANNIPTRYSVGSLPGASFNYGVFGNYFVISTSYNGLKAVLPLLGL